MTPEPPPCYCRVDWDDDILLVDYSDCPSHNAGSGA